MKQVWKNFPTLTRGWVFLKYSKFNYDKKWDTKTFLNAHTLNSKNVQKICFVEKINSI